MQHRFFARAGAKLFFVCLLLGAGFFVGRQIGRLMSIREAQDRLGTAAIAALNDSEAFLHDADMALSGMLASPYAPCSQSDLELMRGLLGNSHLLRELGRIRDNRVVCSTAHERQDIAHTTLQEPYSVGTDGVKVYRNPPGFAIPGVTVTLLESRNAFVELNPFINVLRTRGPEHLSIAVIGPGETRPYPLNEYSSRPRMQQLTTDGDYRLGNNQYATRCSRTEPRCVTAALTDDEAVRLDRADVNTFSIFGMVLGGVIGLFVALEYRRSRGLERQLRRAIARDRLRLVYQPIVELKTRRIVGAEALARWTNEEGDEVRPDIFVGLAEKHGFIRKLTAHVLRRAMNELGTVFNSRTDFHLSVNITAGDLADSCFLPTLRAVLEEAGVTAENVILEITEGSTARNDIAIECIRRLREAGHQVHIDDFGTGYSSLSYLQHLSVDAIKIDRAFTQAIGTGSVIMAILAPILVMAEGLHLKVVVEGIETQEQADYFANCGHIILGQGYLFGRPMPAEELQRVLEADDLRTHDQQAVISEAFDFQHVE